MAEFLLTLALGFVDIFFSSDETLLNRIKNDGELIVATSNTPTTYYESGDEPAGLEYDLVKAFADDLGVQLQIIVPESNTELLSMVAKGRVHLASGLVVSGDYMRSGVRFGPGYQEITTQVVARKGVPRVRNLEELSYSNACTAVALGTSHLRHLYEAKENYPKLAWMALDKVDSVELLQQVWEQLIDYAVVGSNELKYAQRLHPELEAVFDISEPQTLAWAFPRFSRDESLYLAAIQFFNRIRDSGRLNQLIDRYYGHIGQFDYFNTRTFYRHIETRLPRYRIHFEKLAKAYNTDWKLLAAIGYQESKWDPSAVSYTGVRGLMMLTQNTAKEMRVENRTDPYQSIEGGVKYYVKIKNRIPESIPEPDRTWMAIAAYNIGLGHLRDARKLTKRNNGDPDRWVDVREYIFRLSQRKWHSQTRHGYARGFETVKYVKRIREYYDILSRYEDPDAEPPEPVQNNVFFVDSPVL